MTVSDLIEQLQQFHGHESVMVYIHRADVCELTDPLGDADVEVAVYSVEPSSSPQTGTIAKLFLE